MARGNIKIDAKKGEIRHLGHLLHYLKPHKKSILAVFISLLITSSAVLSLGKGVSYLVDEGFGTKDINVLNHALTILFVVIIILAVATYSRFYFITRTGERVIAALRRDIFNHLVNMSPSYFETHKIGEIMSRITTDTTILQMVIGSSLSIALRNILIFTGGLVMLITTSASLAGYIAILIPLIVLPIIILGKKVRVLSRKSQKKVAELASNIEEVLSGAKTVQSYNRQNIEQDRFSGKVQNALSAATDRVKMRAALTAIVIIFAFGSVGIILWLGGKEVIEGNMTGGDLSSFIFFSIIVASSFGALSEVVGDIQRAAGAAEGIIEILNAENHIIDPENPLKLPLRKDLKGEIKFNDITFKYPARDDISALKNISFSAKSGETVAIVGPSGAGKTTILQLLLRFYDPENGTITIDEVDSRKVALTDLRENFAYVPQDPMIFSATAAENIAYGLENADIEDIKSAARKARAVDFIEKMPDGFDSFLGEKGVRVSGGERQRIAIARAILKDPKILLLDEATSALDSQNEQLVQQALDDLMQNRTTIVIAHRLSTILKADKIIVLNEGVIEAEGTHKQLLRKSPLYKRLSDMQFSS